MKDDGLLRDGRRKEGTGGTVVLEKARAWEKEGGSVQRPLQDREKKENLLHKTKVPGASGETLLEFADRRGLAARRGSGVYRC